ncbi:MAG: serine/threonine protein kinase [Sandaracinaceae bacterium]|nr:serine/threonine protein kinase [Sandaracinaceae bacterium]
MSIAEFGRYELIRKIAAGGMADVFLAREWGEAGFFRELAIKRLFPHLVEHAPSLRSFQTEARLMSEFLHPNIPQVYDLGYCDGQWYVAMEYVDGPNLADLSRMSVRNNQPIPLSVALGIIVQIAHGLHHAHERKDRAGRSIGFVHRDLTPQNIMITRDGAAKLIDFGVAQTNAYAEERGLVRGTYAYMAPEQVRGHALDRRSDVFALGIILYELTTGVRLFSGDEVRIMRAITEEDVPPPSYRVAGYPIDLEAIVMAALARDPDQRIATAADLALHLENFAMNARVLIGPPVVAHHLREVAPSERLPEEELGFVDPRISQPGMPAPFYDQNGDELDPDDTGVRRSLIPPGTPGGAMQSGIYSDSARAMLDAIEDEIAELSDLFEEDDGDWDEDDPR